MCGSSNCSAESADSGKDLNKQMKSASIQSYGLEVRTDDVANCLRGEGLKKGVQVVVESALIHSRGLEKRKDQDSVET